jgi:hypothetical protein
MKKHSFALLTLCWLTAITTMTACKKDAPALTAPGAAAKQTLQSSPVNGNIWNQLPNPLVLAPTGDLTGISFTANNKVYMAATSDNQLWQYDPATAAWTLLKSPFYNFTPPNSTSGLSFAFNNGNNVYFISDDKSLRQYNLATGLWAVKNPFPGTTAVNCSAAFTATTGYIMANSNENWAYDFGSNTWTRKANLPGLARSLAAAYCVGDKIYFGTGYSLVPIINPVTFRGSLVPTTVSDWWEYSTTLNTWTQKTAFPGGGRMKTRGFVLNDKVYLGIGDASYGFTDAKVDMWSYDPASNAWASRAPSPEAATDGPVPIITMTAAAGKGYEFYGYAYRFWSYTPQNTFIPPILH